MDNMKFHELISELDETENRVRHWLAFLRKAELVNERGRRLKNEFTDEEVACFRKIKTYLAEGVETVPEAIRLIKDSITPSDALERAIMLNRQVDQLQKKVIALRKPSIWEKMTQWFGSLFRKKVTREEQST